MTAVAVACGGLRARAGESSLRLAGSAANVTLRVGLPIEVARRVAPAALDLFETAAYAWAAEPARPSAISLRVPLRSPGLFGRRDVRATLSRLGGFLLGAPLTVEPVAATRPLGSTALLSNAPATLATFPRDAPVEVVLFSGGLDSLVGALDTVARGGWVALVHHHEAPRVDPRVAALAEAVRARAPERVAFVPVWLSCEGRSRPRRLTPLVLSAAAFMVASAFGPGSAVRFFENGVVGLALPVSAAGLAADRPSQGAHPQVLAALAALSSRLGGRETVVDNGFLFATKGEVAAQLVGHEAEGLVRGTTSCRSFARGRHCGACAPCIDRRFAILAAGLEAHDPAAGYAIDLLTGARRGASRTVAAAYVRAAIEITDEGEAEFFGRHGELARVLRALPGDPSIQAARVHDLHVRHAREVERVLDAATGRLAGALRRGALPSSSLLVLALPPSPRVTPPKVAPRARPRATSRGASIRVLHLSDFHFSARRAWDQDPVLAAVVERVRVWTREGLGPHVVALTGDIADRGAPDEYARATAFFTERLLPAVELPADRLFVVPGNHDVDRSMVREVARATEAALLGAESQDVLAAVLGDARERAPLLRRHDAYLDFVAALRGAPRSAVPWWSARLEIEGLVLHLGGLCSSFLASSDADKGRLLVSRYQLHEVLEGARGADVSLALAHHPWDYLADFDAHEVREAVQRSCTATLRGHLHAVDAGARVRPNDTHLELAAGATYGGARHPHGFSLVEFCPAEEVARLRPVVWDAGTFIPDRNILGGSRDGVLVLPIGRLTTT